MVLLRDADAPLYIPHVYACFKEGTMHKSLQNTNKKQLDWVKCKLSNGSCFVDSIRRLRPVCYVEGATWVPSSWLWQFDVEETAPHPPNVA